MASPEEALAIAIIGQAILDARLLRYGKPRHYPGNRHRKRWMCPLCGTGRLHLDALSEHQQRCHDALITELRDYIAGGGFDATCDLLDVGHYARQRIMDVFESLDIV